MTDSPITHPHDRRPPRDRAFELSEYFDNEAINSFRLTGSILAVDYRRSGTAVLTIQAGSMRDRQIDANGYRHSTSRYLVRVPPRLREQWHDDLLEDPCIVTITGRINGVAETIDGRVYLLQELIAHDIRWIARYGAVFVNPKYRFRPFIEHEGDGATNPQARALDALHGHRPHPNDVANMAKALPDTAVHDEPAGNAEDADDIDTAGATDGAVDEAEAAAVSANPASRTVASDGDPGADTPA